MKDWEEAYDELVQSDPWANPPALRSLIQELGAEAFGTYLSFRLEGDRWGIYMRGGPIVGLAKEVLRVLQLGFFEFKEVVPEDMGRKLAFRMAFDMAFNHLAFHASVDAFAAAHELEDGRPYYGPYFEGPYTRSLEDPEGKYGYNLEEALANVIAMRGFLNPSLTVEMGDIVRKCFSEDELFRWNAYLMSGNLTTEIAYLLRSYPPGYRNFTGFLRRRGEVGPYAHMAVQYDLDTEAFNQGVQRLIKLLLQGKEVKEGEKEILKPVGVKLYLVPE